MFAQQLGELPLRPAELLRQFCQHGAQRVDFQLWRRLCCVQLHQALELQSVLAILFYPGFRFQLMIQFTLPFEPSVRGSHWLSVLGANGMTFRVGEIVLQAFDFLGEISWRWCC